MNKYVLTVTYKFECKTDAEAKKIVERLKKDLPLGFKPAVLRTVKDAGDLVYTETVRYYR